jgi:PAS domain S-box-containing protein
MNKFYLSFIHTLQANQELHLLLNEQYIIQTLIVRESSTKPSTADFQFVGLLLWDLLPGAWTQILHENTSTNDQQKKVDLNLDETDYTLLEKKQPNQLISIVIFSNLRKKSQNFTTIQQQLALKLSGEDDLQTLLSATLEACLKVSKMDAGGVYLINPEQDHLELHYHKGLTQDFIDAVSVYPRGSDRWKLVQHGAPTYLAYESIPLSKDETLISEGIKSVAVLPIRYMGRIMGCVNVASHHFTNVTSDQRWERETTKFRQLFDDLSGCFLLVRFDGKILFANQYLLTTLGYQRESLLAQSVFTLFQPDSREKLQQNLHHIQDQYLVDGLTILSHDGSPIGVDASVSMTSWDGEPVYALWFQKSVEKANVPILESAAQSLNLYDDLPIPVMFVDPTSMMVYYANQFVSDQYGYLKSEMMQKNFFQFFDSNEYHKIATLLREYRMEEINRIVWNQIDAYGQKMRVRFFIRIIFRGEKTLYVVVPNPVISLEDENYIANQDRYRSVLDQQTDIILRFSPDGLITYVNQAYCEFFNKSSQELIGTSFMENVYAADFDIVSAHLALLTPERPLRESKNRMLDGNKNVRWFRWIDRAIFEGNQLMEVQSVGRDITETEEEALKSINLEAQFRSLIENSPAIIYFLEAKSLFPIYVNDQLEKMTGYTKQAFLKDSEFWKTIIHPEDYKNWLTTMNKRQANEQTKNIEFRVLTKSGQLIWLKEEGHLIELRGQGLFIEGIISNITHQKESEEKQVFYLGLERLINQIINKLVNTLPENLPQTIQETLRMIGQFIGVDRSYIFYYDETNRAISNRYEWCAEGVRPQRDNLQNISIKELPYFYETVFVDQKFFQTEDINQLSLEATREKNHFSQQDIKSILVVPIMIHNKVIGFMGFDSVNERSQWSEETVALLQVVSNLIVFAESRS